MPTATSNPPTGTIVAGGQFATALGSGLREIDVNPLIVGVNGTGTFAVDVIVVMDD
jgi:hypothetical protein